jgi:quercetin dioxygenase-like cupin family protein
METRRTALKTLGAVFATAPALWADAGAATETPLPSEGGVTVTVVLDNARFRASRVVFEPGGGETPHTHDWDLITVALTPADLEVVRGTETVRVRRAPGDVGLIPKGAVHAARNLGRAPAEFVTIALKGPAAGSGDESGPRPSRGDSR